MFSPEKGKELIEEEVLCPENGASSLPEEVVENLEDIQISFDEIEMEAEQAETVEEVTEEEAEVVPNLMIGFGIDEIQAEYVAEIIAAENRDIAGPTAPPQGLFLTDVFYDFEKDTYKKWKKKIENLLMQKN